MIDLVFKITGMFVWTLIGSILLWLIGEVFLALLNSISYHRWCYECAKARGYEKTLRWRRLPTSLFIQAWRMIGHRKGGTKYFHEDGSEWFGIGDWHTGWKNA